jgi:hypothetical protein
MDGREPQLPKGSKIRPFSYTYNIELHTSAGGYSVIPGICIDAFMVHTDLFRLQILLLFILIGKPSAWICSGSRNLGSKK